MHKYTHTHSSVQAAFLFICLWWWWCWWWFAPIDMPFSSCGCSPSLIIHHLIDPYNTTHSTHTMATTTEPKAPAKDDAAPLLDVLEEDDEFEVCLMSICLYVYVCVCICLCLPSSPLLAPLPSRTSNYTRTHTCRSLPTPIGTLLWTRRRMSSSGR